MGAGAITSFQVSQKLRPRKSSISPQSLQNHFLNKPRPLPSLLHRLLAHPYHPRSLPSLMHGPTLLPTTAIPGPHHIHLFRFLLFFVHTKTLIACLTNSFISITFFQQPQPQQLTCILLDCDFTIYTLYSSHA